MARGHLAQSLTALCLLIFEVALHAEARTVPDTTRDCGPLQKHRYRCDPPLTRTIQAHPEQPAPTNIHAAASIQGVKFSHAPPASAHELQEDIASHSSTSGAAHDGVEAVATSIPITEDPECGPLEKNRFRCGNPPRIRVRGINALG